MKKKILYIVIIDKFFFSYRKEIALNVKFLKFGKKYGNKVLNGKMMFIYQAFFAFKLWHSLEPEINNDILKLLDQ